MKKEKDFHRQDPTWCRGCGLFGVFAGLKKAAVALDLNPEQMVIVSGIGCHGRLNNYFHSNGFHGLHGRTLPVATGIKLANQRLTVLAVAGDGDAYSIGLSHFIHTLRRNVDVTYLVVDNRLYALTQGQTSPTSPMGFVSISTPFGSKELALDGPLLALASGGTFIARGFSGNPRHLATLIVRAIQHRGLSLVEVLSPCVTHNKLFTYQWLKDNIEPLDNDPGYDPGNKEMAWSILTRAAKIPAGLIYVEERPSFDELVLPAEAEPLVTSHLRVDARKLGEIMEGFK